MKPSRKWTAALIALLAAAVVELPADADDITRPKLVVVVVIDQMRADYIDRFARDWTGGLKRLVTEGAWFRESAYPYLNTLTCAGHATIATGTFPHVHGIMQNAWWDRGSHSIVQCSADSSATSVSYGGPPTTTEGNSARNLRVPTFGEYMRSAVGSRLVTLSLKERSAIMLAGHAGDAVTWLTNALDGWQTSTAYTDKPVPAVKAFVDANPIDADYGKTWTRMLPESRYREVDDAPWEAPPVGWGRTFPHTIASGIGKPDFESRTQWERTPYADAYLARLAAALVESMHLGTRDRPDVLGVSFSTPDLIGHAFGPDSQEIRDAYAHLDQTMGVFLDRLDRLVGRGQYVVALSADHGVTPVPEALEKRGLPSGRFNTGRMTDAIDSTIASAFGPGHYVARLTSSDVYFEPGVYARLKATPSVLDAVVRTISAVNGVSRVFHEDELRTVPAAGDRELRAAALSFVPETSGDLVISAKPGWLFTTANAATHGAATSDDQRVPILLMGYGVRPGQYSQRTTPADIAPTLAALCGIVMPKVEGRVLKEAISVRPR